MTVKSILCPYQGNESELAAVRAALQLAEDHLAGVRFLHVTPDPAADTYINGFDAFSTATYTTLLKEAEKSYAAKRKTAEKTIAKLAGQKLIPLRSHISLRPMAFAKFQPVVGSMDHFLRRFSSVSDVIVVGQGCVDDEALYNHALTVSLIQTDRPVLYIPKNKKDTPLLWRRTCLAWDGTLEASRALYNSLPLIRAGSEIHILSVVEHGKNINTKELEDYLRLHGFVPKSHILHCKDRNIGEALRAKALKLKADIFIMGAYHHSRLGEMLWGGVTDYMLSHTRTPLLLSH